MQPTNNGTVANFMVQLLSQVAMKFDAGPMGLLCQFRFFNEFLIASTLLSIDFGRAAKAWAFD